MRIRAGTRASARLCLLVAATLVLGANAAAADELGPPIGSKAPAFDLSDQNGESHSFQSLLSRGKLAIIFYRSADW